jgi:hypothetical protein
MVFNILLFFKTVEKFKFHYILKEYPTIRLKGNMNV